MIRKAAEFTRSTNFSNALKVTLAAAIPVVAFSYAGEFQTGFAIALGALLTYPGDIPSNIRHKVIGILVAALIVAGANLFVNLLHPYPLLLYPLFALLIFLLAMISVYGHRAAMVSFSGLLASTLALADIHEGWEMLGYSGLMLSGGLFYLLISLLFEYLRPHRYVELQIAECIRLTAKYMKLRGDLWDPGADKAKITERQLALQVELNIIHENLREILIRNRSGSGSSTHNRKMLLVFIASVEILEIALSTSFNHERLHLEFRDNPKVLTTYQQLAYNLAATLRRISKSIARGRQYIPRKGLQHDLQLLESGILEYRNENSPDTNDSVLMLTNMMHYAEKQIEKISIIERAFSVNPDLKELGGRDRELDRFLTPQYYPIRTLVENIGFSSLIFRHSLRITVTLMFALLLGRYFVFGNAYWILLTIIVIMRPGYGLTKQRSRDRVLGTIAGSLVAFGLLVLVDNVVIIGIMAVLFMLLGFAFTQIDYKVAAAFVTIYVILLYGLITPDSNQVIEYRIIDTIIGAGLAFAANYFLWPGWESRSAPGYIKKAIEANRNYLEQISVFYNEKGEVTTAYRIARKNAFIEVGNLMASFQRMAQEPRSRQKGLRQLYKLVELNHALLSAVASLGTYIQTQPTTKASEAFMVVVNTVIRNLEQSIAVIDATGSDPAATTVSEDLGTRFSELRNIRAHELRDQADFDLRMQESQLIIGQLTGLVNLSEGILKVSRKPDLKQ